MGRPNKPARLYPSVASNERSPKVLLTGSSSSREVKGVVGSGKPDPPQDEVCPECGRTFKGKRGVNVHRRSAHPESYHSEKTEVIGAAISAQSKRRWDTEEEAIMANKDARMRERGMLSMNIVAELAAAMPHRTKEAIKYRRQKPEYRILVESYMVASGDDGRGIVPSGASRPRTTPGDDGRGIVPSGASRPPIDGSEAGTIIVF